MDRVTSLLKALDLLGILAGHPKGLKAHELASMMNLARTTVLRVLNTVVEYGFVMKQGRCYVVTRAFREWAMPQRHGWLKRRYRKLLESIAAQTGELVLLGTLEGTGVVHLDFVAADHAVRVAPAPWTHHNIRHNAIGKLILSQRKDLAEHWLQSEPEFDLELNEVRRSGIAWNREETVSGMVAMAVNGLWAVHSEPKIAVAWPLERFDEKRALEVADWIHERVKNECQ
jgi:DNA-binding IclR family transcriptional regulator